MRVMLVDDDRAVASMVRRLLVGEGLDVDTCHRGRDVLEQVRRIRYDVVLLDWTMPDLDGIEVLRDLRAASVTTPVIMLTSRSDPHEKAFALDAGADDFVAKPFDPDEFLARLRAVVRRTHGLGEIRIEGLHLDRLRHVATADGRRVDLTSKEIDFLFVLAARHGLVVSRFEILRDVWGYDFDPGSNIIEVTTSRLRQKLGDYGWVVATERGRGYRLRTRRTDESAAD